MLKKIRLEMEVSYDLDMSSFHVCLLLEAKSCQIFNESIRDPVRKFCHIFPRYGGVLRAFLNFSWFLCLIISKTGVL